MTCSVRLSNIQFHFTVNMYAKEILFFFTCNSYSSLLSLFVYVLHAVDLPPTMCRRNMDPKWHYIIIYFDGKCGCIAAWIVDV